MATRISPREADEQSSIPHVSAHWEQTHIGSMTIIMMGEGGGRERICTALPCFATSRRS